MINIKINKKAKKGELLLIIQPLNFILGSLQEKENHKIETNF